MKMKRKYQKKPLKQRQIALERINILFEQAKKVFKKDPSLSNRYVSLARKIAMKYKIRIPSNLKKQFCKHCYKFLVPSVNVRVRTRKGKVVYYCLYCKKYMRFPYKKRKSKQKT